MEAAEMAGIPAKSAREMLYDSLARFLKAKTRADNSGHRFQMMSLQEFDIKQPDLQAVP
jgi:hypothetical protein